MEKLKFKAQTEKNFMFITFTKTLRGVGFNTEIIIKKKQTKNLSFFFSDGESTCQRHLLVRICGG